MMKLYKYPGKKSWPGITQRPVADVAALEKRVKKILEKVKKDGDKAIRKYTKKFDGVKLKDFSVSEQEISQASSLLSDELKRAIRQAKANIELFHSSQIEEEKRIVTMPGVVCWRKAVPIERVGLYIPGGSAPLFSTVLMLGVPAQLAGCNEIILCTPPSPLSPLRFVERGRGEGEINPAVLYAAQLCGITKIYKAGGVQAIAAMAFGTETILKVNKIFGPGNQYVTLAKQMIQQQGVAIDFPAGPSEVLVIADETAVPAFAAADLLSQAEHGPDSQVILVTTDETIAEKVTEAIKQQLKELPRKEIAEKALANSKLILVENISLAIEISNLYAPEHLILSCANAEELSKQIISAGSVFIGNYSPESAGDYASGTNHTLPTNGFAATYSGVSLDSFVKKITYQQLTKAGLENLAGTIMIMAEAEGLAAHKNAVAVRLKN